MCNDEKKLSRVETAENDSRIGESSSCEKAGEAGPVSACAESPKSNGGLENSTPFISANVPSYKDQESRSTDNAKEGGAFETGETKEAVAAGENTGVSDAGADLLKKQFTARSLMKFAVPTVIMQLFTSLYTIVDGMIVARFVGPTAMAAISIVFPSLLIFMGIAIMVSVGGSALIANKLGEGKTEEARQDFTVVCITSLLIAAVGMSLCFAFMKPLLSFLGATDALMPYCVNYYTLILAGTPFLMLQIFFQIFFVTAGRPKIGLISIIFAGVFNMAFDYIFVVPCDMGISGAALATSMSYLIPTVVGGIFFFRRKSPLFFVRPKLNRGTLRKSFSNGSSEMVTNIASGVISFLFNRTLLNLEGETGVAAMTILLYCQMMFTAVCFGFSSGVSPVISYKYGARDTPQLKKVFKISVLFITVSSAVLTALAYACMYPAVLIFTKPGTETFNLAIRGFLLFSVNYLFAGFNLFSSSLFTALGNGKVSALLSFMRTFAFITVSLFLFPIFLKTDGVWLAIPFAEAASFAFSLAFVLTKRRKYNYA